MCRIHYYLLLIEHGLKHVYKPLLLQINQFCLEKNMQHILEKIIRHKPTFNDPIVNLRCKFICCEVNINQLLQGPYTLYKAQKPGWHLLIRPISNRYQQLCILVARDQRIAMITYSNYLDIPEEGLVGWYPIKTLSKNAANRISKELSDATTINSRFKEKVKYYDELSFLRIDDLSAQEIDQIDSLISGLTYECYRKKDYGTAAILLNALLKEIENIDDSDILTDISFYCGRLRMEEEFYTICEYIYSKNIEWSDTSITNLGSVMCDTFQLYEIANECFVKALELNPFLFQATANLVVSTKRLMWEYTNSNKYVQAIDIGLECMNYCDSIEDPTFWVILALSYELNEDVISARKYYKEALAYDPKCQISQTGIRRIDGIDFLPSAKHSSLLSLKSVLNPSSMREDLICTNYFVC